MKVKYKIGDYVYAYHGTEGVLNFKIKDIIPYDNSFIYSSGIIESTVYNAYIEVYVDESEVYSTKEEAVNSTKPKSFLDTLKKGEVKHD